MNDSNFVVSKFTGRLINLEQRAKWQVQKDEGVES